MPVPSRPRPHWPLTAAGVSAMLPLIPRYAHSKRSCPMSVSWSKMFAERTSRMKASDIRELLKLTARPEIISLAGGLPAPELFPIDEYRAAFEWVLETNGSAALQYGPSEGYLPLRQFLAERMTRLGIPAEVGQVLITNGSQQGLDLVGK